ncbi:hypothetical protein [Pseudomonas petrae]|uniref:Uncharacterized protein n=1 Tax=Pseudomonas petrae TaxID=2912190 RepID=A0ABS9I0Y2_9PSED|nr:hypothetical protein [Pseudomonas petrae]MCF7531428.1 hypothetical protein [Pseudomonas petrae]MCF7536986.1 hypothetical protein [Pseudomonas petrae]MCF7540666.1 hypothetical protein [Pseudomonas petrae]MCF7556550.1 hypothetical protein [Pseudomonas petrae]
MKHDPDDWARSERMSADEDDLRPRSRAVAGSTLYRNVFLLMAALVGCAYLFLHERRPEQTAPAPSRDVEVTPTPVDPPRPAMQARAAVPQPLADCIKDGNMIDETVVRCRFGQHPQPRDNPQAQGMVSTAYMAQFKAGQQRADRPHEQFSETRLVQQWDGKAWYTAHWLVLNNQIDSTSVCANLRRGSIEFRECRKGAKVWFRNECRKGGDDASHQRYCSAASSFNPMG